MIRVGIDGHMLGDHSGGNEVYYTNILKNMIIPEDMEVYLFVKPDAPLDGIKDKFNIVYFESKNAFVRNFIELTLLCLKYKLDILHTQYFIPFIRPCEVVCTIHDICFEHFNDIFTKKEYLRQKVLIPYAAKKCYKIITVSEFSKQDIASTYKINPDKIIVTYNAVDDRFHPLSEDEIDRKSLENQYGICGEYILTVGNLQPRKNITRLIKAYELLRKSYDKDIKLVIVGKKAWMYDDIFKEALNNADVASDIIFTGYVEHEDLARIYAGAKCFVYPSLYEGFGIPPLEALACGTPVAVSNSSSLPEVIGKCGTYFDPVNVEEMAECILNIIRDIHVDEQGVENHIQRFDWKKSAKIVMRIYQE